MIEPAKISDIMALDPSMQDIAKKVLSEITAQGIPIKVFETRRTPERQLFLWQKGRDINGNIINQSEIVTMIKDPRFHGKGLAMDCVVFVNNDWSWNYIKYAREYGAYGNIAQKNGLIWGGSWVKFKDYPHTQLGG